MNLKGFFGTLLLIIGGCFSLLAGGCAFLMFVVTGGSAQGLILPFTAFLAGLLVSWLGVMLMNSAGRDHNLSPAEEEKRKASIKQAMKAGAERAALAPGKKKDEAKDGEA